MQIGRSPRCFFSGPDAKSKIGCTDVLLQLHVRWLACLVALKTHLKRGQFKSFGLSMTTSHDPS